MYGIKQVHTHFPCPINQSIELEEQKLLTKLLIEDLDEGCEAIGGAGSIADDGVGGAVLIGIHSHNVGRNVSFPRSSDQHLLRSCLNVLPSSLLIHKHSGSLNNKINAQIPDYISSIVKQ